MDESSYLHECFRYDSETGKLYWKVRPLSHFFDSRAAAIFNKKYPGNEFGSFQRSGKGGGVYRGGSINNKHFKTHRIIWAMAHGSIPDGVAIDHINHNKIDNRLENLRLVTDEENRRNCPLLKSNKSGFSGVHWYPHLKKWRSVINVNRKTIHLGYFNQKEDAVRARQLAQQQYGFHENHGKPMPANAIRAAGIKVKE